MSDIAVRDYIDVRIDAMRELVETIHALSQRTADRAAEVQHEHNVGQNEWRAFTTGIINDRITRVEHDRLVAQVVAIQLEVSSFRSAVVSEQQTERESHSSAFALWGAIVAACVVLAEVAQIAISLWHNR